MNERDQDLDTSLTFPRVHCARCGSAYEYWQLLTCNRCHKHCCISCVHRVAIPAERLGVAFEIEKWYCLECYTRL